MEQAEQPRPPTLTALTPRQPTPLRGRSSQGGIAGSDRRAIERLVNRAIDDGLSLMVTWMDMAGPHVDEIEPIDLHEDAIHAYALGDSESTEIVIPFTAILELLPDELLSDDPFDDEGL
jgi:hypothetical protein